MTKSLGFGPKVTRETGIRGAHTVKELFHEGNVRRIVTMNHTGHTVIEIPMTAGVVAAVVAPVVTAVGTTAALVNEWSIEVERPGAAHHRRAGRNAGRRLTGP